VRHPVWMKWDRELTDEEGETIYIESKRLNVPVRSGDQFARFDECAILDFLRFLGVRVELRDEYVTLLAQKFRSFWIAGQSTYDEAWSRIREALAKPG